ncbi:MAG: alpha/beta fold hydrolase [Ilumatobacteraceae bacterium]
MQTVTVNDVDLAWDSHGDGPDTLLLVHGFTGSSLDWTDVVDGLAPHVRVVTYDHRGHGESTNTGDEATYTFDQLAADLTGFVDAIGLDAPFHLLGHSMGGMVGMRWGLADQARLRSLILMDTGAEPMTGAEKMFGPAIEVARTHGMDALAELMADLSPARPPAIAARNRWKLQHMDPAAFAGLGRQIATVPGVLSRLHEITVPTTVFLGTEDQPFVEISAQMAEAIPGAELVTFEGAGHCPQEDDPAAWTDAVLRHLRRA